MRLNDPKLILTFLGNDLEPGHSTEQEIDSSYIVNLSAEELRQLLNGLKSSSDTLKITLFRRCPSVEDIIATEGNIKVQLYDEDQLKWTGFLSTNYSYAITDHGEQALVCTIETVGTRLFNRTFIETGYHFFDCAANAAVYAVISPLGLTIRSGDERKLLQPVRKEVDSKMTRRQILDQLFYECNSVYSFNERGELCITNINADTAEAPTVSSDHLFTVNGKAVSLTKALRTYKGARVQYTETAGANNYLVYRNTTGQDNDHQYCNLKLGPGEYFDGAEIYTAAEWSEATADAFREPTLISACNADSESSIVGSGEIMSISDIQQRVIADFGIEVAFEHVGGKWFKLTCHNTGNTDRYILRLDLYADIVFVKSNGVIRTQITGPADGKALLEEELTWIHDKDNAQRHANLLADYNKSCGAQYTFYSDLSIALGSVIKLHESTFSGLEVFVLVYARKSPKESDIYEYKAVGVSSFNLDQPAYHGTSESGKQSGKQGPKGEPGPASEVQYAIGDSIIYPPGDDMQWSSADMLWGGDPMLWNTATWGDAVPPQERGKYIWMRTRVGDGPWQYSRLTGSTSWDPENLGVCTTACPTTSKSGLGLIPGDYFVAGATFNDPSPSGPEYKRGYAYTYTGSTWDEMDLTDPNNSAKALQLASNLFASGINVTDSTASIWAWFKNMVAQNAVIESLWAQQAFIEDLQATVATLKNLVVTGNIFNDVLTTNNAVNSAGTFTFLSSAQNRYNRDGEVDGSRQAVKISDIEAVIGPDSKAVLCSGGSITIDGTTWSASATDIIKLKYTKDERLVIYAGTMQLVTYAAWFFDSSYVYHSSEPGYLMVDSGGIISANSLSVTTSLGSISVHSVLPQNSAYDNLASEEIPFNKGWIKELTVKNRRGLNYQYDSTGAYMDSISDANDHSRSFEYDGQAFVSVRVEYNGSFVDSGLYPLRALNGGLAPESWLFIPISSSNGVRVYFKVNPVAQMLYWKCPQASSSTLIDITFTFYK